jgi:hypothetical protein
MSTSKIGVKREQYRVRGICFALYKAKLKETFKQKPSFSPRRRLYEPEA